MAYSDEVADQRGDLVVKALSEETHMRIIQIRVKVIK